MAKKKTKQKKKRPAPETKTRQQAEQEILKKLQTSFGVLNTRKSASNLTSQRLKITSIANEDVTDCVSHVLAKFPNLKMTELVKIYANQFRQYNQELVLRKLALSQDELQALDCIDMRAIGAKSADKHTVPELNLPDELSKGLTDYINDTDMGFYRTLPCFSEGALRLNTDRYIYFKVLHIDLENRKYKVLLRDYANAVSNGEKLWQPGVYGITTVMNEPDSDSYEIKAEEPDCTLFYDIYRQISPKELGWNRIQKTAWTEIALANAKSASDKMKQAGTNNVIQLACLFLRYITIANFILENNKPKIAPGQKEKQEHNKRISKKSKSMPKESSQAQEQPDNAVLDAIPEKLIRNIGLIKIVSTRTPKVFSSKSIRNYKIPSWTSRGHTRKYKSGKIVYVRPAVHHRKALKNQNGKIPQSVINLVNNNAEKAGEQHN